jgi:hypothetical protein
VWNDGVLAQWATLASQVLKHLVKKVVLLVNLMSLVYFRRVAGLYERGPPGVGDGDSGKQRKAINI